MRSLPVGFRVVFWLLLTAFAVELVRNAWVGDDAYITFRVADNAARGYGLRFNVAERVQACTHPLWMLLVPLVHVLFGHIYYSSLALSLVASLAAVVLVCYGARGWQGALAALL